MKDLKDLNYEEILKNLTYEEFEREADKKDKRVYKRVLNRFPEINKGKVRLKILLPQGNEILGNIPCISMIDALYFMKFREYKPRPTIYLIDYFQPLRDDTKETILAHELGHYLQDRKKSIETIARNVSWYLYYNKKMEKYKKLSHPLFHFSGKARRRYERLKRWALSREKRADEEAAKRGYGKRLLGFQKGRKNILEKHGFHDNDLKSRIENLETILKK